MQTKMPEVLEADYQLIENQKCSQVISELGMIISLINQTRISIKGQVSKVTNIAHYHNFFYYDEYIFLEHP